VSAAKHLGFLACDGCGRERAEAEDRDAWTIVARLGVLERVVCTTCQDERASTESVALELSDHAVEQWHERVRPGLTLEQAEEDLARQLETHGRWEAPGWLPDEELADARWLMVGDDVAFPVRGELVMSCLVRASYDPKGRRLATSENSFAKRARRARERPERRRWEGKAATRSRRRERDWEVE
jgi:hypothetical protein